MPKHTSIWLSAALTYLACNEMHKFVVRSINLKHEDELRQMHHDAFHAGWRSAVDDPSVTYNHYVRFKKLNEAPYN